jgi:hypothetical protein
MSMLKLTDKIFQTKIGTNEIRIELIENRVVRKDFTVTMWRIGQMGIKVTSYKATRNPMHIFIIFCQTKLFAFSLHANFVNDDLILAKDDIDIAVNDKDCDIYSNNARIALNRTLDSMA